MVNGNPLIGVGWHSVGALSAASCYTPQKKTGNWAWKFTGSARPLLRG